MELRELATFVKVAESGSFTRAAESLNLSQPAVTRQIAHLERELHTPLLDRLGRRARLTSAGEALYASAVEILRLEQEAHRAVNDVMEGSVGQLTLGASTTAATYVLPALLQRFREGFPGVDLSVSTGASTQILEKVRANTVDAGIVTHPGKPVGMRVLPVTDLEMVVVLPLDHPLSGTNSKGKKKNTKGTSLGAADLSGCPMILMHEETHLRRYVDTLLAEKEVSVQVTMELDSVEAIKKMVEAGLGVSILPRVAVLAEEEAGRLAVLPLMEASLLPRRIAAVLRRDKYLSKPLKGFLRLLSQPALESNPSPPMK